jgi:uncharacterized protein (TIGR02453 family)
MAAAPTHPITPRLFRFLRELTRNNDRAWFNANKPRYIADVRDPLLAFISAFAPELAKFAPALVADPRPVGGSLFRIYRDTRFAKDKSPYKTAAGMSFRHADGNDVHGPIFYLHLEPGRVFSAAGIWYPPSDALKSIRDAIVAQPDRWKRVTRTKGCALDDSERLSRPPRGYPADHPQIEDLKRKTFTTAELQRGMVSAVGDFSKACRRATPLWHSLPRP